ncbi:MAG: hypothetical protein CAK86_05540 [Opitutia bacterium AMD-G1]|nr:MAG: hypothetical protein CAK86_05540 [Opitutae bacterium AMD-G1]
MADVGQAFLLEGLTEFPDEHDWQERGRRGREAEQDEQHRPRNLAVAVQDIDHVDQQREERRQEEGRAAPEVAFAHGAFERFTGFVAGGVRSERLTERQLRPRRRRRSVGVEAGSVRGRDRGGAAEADGAEIVAHRHP